VAEVRCPKCQVVLTDGHRRPARCPACHEALVSCRYCRFYDPALQDCTHLSRREIDHVMDVDEIVDCPDFASTLRPTPAHLTRRALLRTTITTMVVASLIAFTVIFAVRRAAVPPEAKLPFRLAVSLPDSVMKDEELELTVTLLNTTEDTIQNVEVRITGRGMTMLTFDSLTPAENLSSTSARTLSVTAEIPGGEEQKFVFRFHANRPGKLPLSVTATMPTIEGARVATVESEIIP